VCAGTGSFFITTIENGRRREGSACYLDGKEQQAKDESSATPYGKAVYGKTAHTYTSTNARENRWSRKEVSLFFFFKQYNSIILPA
jgi:hypothetical protein